MTQSSYAVMHVLDTKKPRTSGAKIHILYGSQNY